MVGLEDPFNKIPMNYYPVTSYKSIVAISYIFVAIIAINLLFFFVTIFIKRAVVAV